LEGKEIISWSGFAYLYEQSGFNDETRKKAERLAEAYVKSMRSMEVKGFAKEAAELFYVSKQSTR